MEEQQSNNVQWEAEVPWTTPATQLETQSTNPVESSRRSPSWVSASTGETVSDAVGATVLTV